MINITAKNFTLTKGLETKIIDKFNKFEKYVNKNETFEVLLEANENINKIEVFSRINNKTFKAVEKDVDLYRAIDLVIDKVDKQIRKHLDKKIKKGEKSLRYANTETKTQKTEKNDEPKIVKRKFFSQKPMFEEEAMAQMELLNHRSFIFYNADSQTVSMLYKRHDGDYGLIELE